MEEKDITLTIKYAVEYNIKDGDMENYMQKTRNVCNGVIEVEKIRI